MQVRLWYAIENGKTQGEHKIRVGLWITDNKEMCDSMYQRRDEIEAALGFPLTWMRLDKKKASIVCTYIKGLDFKKQDKYDQLMNDAIDLVIKMRKVLPRYM